LSSLKFRIKCDSWAVDAWSAWRMAMPDTSNIPAVSHLYEVSVEGFIEISNWELLRLSGSK
jgi:hypothetical protein